MEGTHSLRKHPDVSISDFQLPGDDPAGGISLAVTVSASSLPFASRCSLPLSTVQTKLTNPRCADPHSGP